MTLEERIAQLEALLEQIASRRTEPRVSSIVPGAMPVAPEPIVLAAPTDATHTIVATDDENPHDDVSGWPSDADARIPLEESTRNSLESRSRLVSSTVDSEIGDELDELGESDVDDDDDVSEMHAKTSSSPSIEISELEAEDYTDEDEELLAAVAAEELAAEADITEDEIEEPAPSSSRRPIVTDVELEDEPDEDSAPRHTPPPESGRQVAAPPVMQRDFTPEVTGVREARRPTSAPPPPARLPTPPPPALMPEVTRTALAASDAVASFVHAPPPFKAYTFGELLEAALEL